MGFREDGQFIDFAVDLAGQRIEVADPLDFVIEQLDPNGFHFRIARKQIDDFPAHPISPPAAARNRCVNTAFRPGGGGSRA